MTRFFKKCLTFCITLLLIASFSYFVVLPRVLPRGYQYYVEKYSKQYQLDESLVNAVIFCESHFEPDAVSSANAIGLMQITQETGWWAAEQMNLNPDTVDLYDPETNIRIGCWYLNWLNKKFDGIQETALAGYNAGHGNVTKWLADKEKSKDGLTLDEIPYRETKGYVKKVELVQKVYHFIYDMKLF